MWGSIVVLRTLSVWHHISRFPINVPASPHANVYIVALVLALVSGLLFGIVPLRQVLRANPYQIVKAGPSGTRGRRLTLRDVLLVVQVAICGVLITSSLVAVRGLARSFDSNLGFEPRNSMLVETELAMAGFRGDQVPAMQKRMVDSIRALPGVESVGLISQTPLYGGGFSAAIFADRTTDLRPSNAAATAIKFNISPQYLHSAGTVLLAGRGFSGQDDKGSPRVAMVNREFARKIFGSTRRAVGGRFKLRDGTRIQVVGVVEDGKYDVPHRRS